jgi:hypothetical protein
MHRWISLDSLGTVPIPSPHRRAIDDLLSQEPRQSQLNPGQSSAITFQA